jgi:hypothetical protein
MGLSFTIYAGPRQHSHSQVRVPRPHYHILLSQFRDSPNLEGQVPVFISPRNRVARLYPQALGSIFVASYDSQSCGGGIGTRLHTVRSNLTRSVEWYSLGENHIENTASNSTSIVERGPLPSNGSGTVAYLRSCCLAMEVVSWSYSSNESIRHNKFLLHYC